MPRPQDLHVASVVPAAGRGVPWAARRRSAARVERGWTVAGFETQAALSKAREAASLASYDIQKLSEDSVERQALHNLLTAVDALINAVDADFDSDDNGS